MNNLRILILFAMICPSAAMADIYRTVGKDGVVHFTNAPSGGRYEIFIREGAKEETVVAPSCKAPGWVMDYAEKMSVLNDLSPALVKAIIKAESNGHMKAVSRRGAKGMMQLMPFTSRRLRVSDPFDPVENIEGGVRYIKELLLVFQGNLTHAVAAYNAGPEAVRKYGGVPPYRETRIYVNRVMTYYKQYSAVK